MNASVKSKDETDSSLLRVPKARNKAPTKVLPGHLTSKITGLDKRQLSLLHSKQRRLKDSPQTHSAATSALVFAQEEAGTAVCISKEGMILTCCHCVAEDPTAAETTIGSHSWLVLASGAAVQSVCLALDFHRDLALLQIVAAQIPSPFPFASEALSPPKIRAPLVCIGHPGSEDLEVGRQGVKTGYDVLHVSTGRFLGYADQDLQDNSEIGALKHDCWTYWGHSGAPLVEQKTGNLVGLHSSWDEITLMRRGIPLIAIKEFLLEHTSIVIE